MTIRHMEASAIADPPFYGPGDGGQSYRQFTHKFADRQSHIAQTFASAGVSKPSRQRELAKLALRDIKQLIAEEAALAGISASDLVLWLNDPIAAVEQLPSRHVQHELTCLRFDNPETKHKKGDLEDLAALGIAVPYCDVVVTEKLLTDLIHRSGLCERYDTTVIRNLNDLLPHLVPAGRVQS